MSAKTNVRWVALSQAVRIATQLISITVLTRLLNPSDYGLMAIAGVFTNLAGLFRDFGTGSALVQRPVVSPMLSNSVFWLNVGLGSLIFLILLAISPLIATYYNEPKLQIVLSLLAITFPITCISMVAGSLLERESRFRLLATVESVSALIALSAALIAAFYGLGIYSLVLQAVLFTILQSSTLFKLGKWVPTLRPSLSGLRDIFGFSANVSAFQFINYFARNADSFIIGKALGPALLGAYSVAYRLMLFPVQNMSAVAARALYPLMSREHAEGKSVAPGYFRFVGAIAFISAPVMAGLFLLREPLISLVFGNKWAQIPGLLAWLAPTGFIQSILSTAGSALMASGNSRTMLKCGISGTVLQVGAFLIGVQYGLTWLVILYFVANLLQMIVVFSLLVKALDARAIDLWCALRFPLIAALAISCLVIGNVHFGIQLNSLSLISQILIVSSAFSILYFGSAIYFAPKQLQMVLALLPSKRG